MDSELQALRERVARTERQLGRLRLLGVIGVVAAAGFLLARPATTQGETTRVRAPFEVVAPDGKPLLRVTAEEGRASLRLYNPEGRFVARLSSAPSGGRLEIINNEFLSAALLDATPDGGGSLAIFYKGAEAAHIQPGRVELWSRPGTARILLRGTPGGAFASLSGAPDEGGTLQMYNKDGVPAFTAP
jgi:hypothetical protein